MKTNLHINIMAMGLFIFLFAGNNLTAQSNWVKYENNPILEGFLEPPGSIATPVVIYDDGIFKMWFYSTGGSTGLNQIYYSESTDGIEWTENEEPVIGAGEITIFLAAMMRETTRLQSQPENLPRLQTSQQKRPNRTTHLIQKQR